MRPLLDDFPKATKAMKAESYVNIEFADGPQTGSRRHYLDREENMVIYKHSDSCWDFYELRSADPEAKRGAETRWHWKYMPEASRGPGGRAITDEDIKRFKLLRTPAGRNKLRAASAAATNGSETTA